MCGGSIVFLGFNGVGKKLDYLVLTGTGTF